MLLQLIPLLVLCYLVVEGIYNRYFHPLRNVPGPFWASFNKAWWFYTSLSGRQHEVHIACHKKYGTFVFSLTLA